MLFIKKEIEVQIEFPRVVYPKLQENWDGKDYDKLSRVLVSTSEEYTALKGEYVLNFKEVTNIAPKKRLRKQTKLEV